MPVYIEDVCSKRCEWRSHANLLLCALFLPAYVFAKGKFVYLDDVWVLDIESMTWQEVRCGGDIPNPRYGHSCHLVGSRMFVVGGKGPNGQLYRDVHFLDLVDWTWVAVNATSTGPSPRCVNHRLLLIVVFLRYSDTYLS